MAIISEGTTSLVGEKEVYTLYRYRFLIGVLYVVAMNLSTMMFAVLGSLQTTLVDVYDESLTYVNFATLIISNVTFIPFSFVSNYIIDTFGLKIGFLVGNILNLIGLWLRVLSKHGFGWIFAGQIFAGIAQPYFATTPQKVSSVWFGPSERVIATTVLICLNLIGNAVGRVCPQWFVDLNADNQTILNQIQAMFLYLALFSSACYVFIIALMRDKPPTPPSKAAAAVKYDYVKSLKSLVMNKNAMMMLIATGVINGTVNSYATTIQQVVAPLNINGYQVSDVIAIALLASPVGFFIGGGLLAKLKKYNLITISLGVLSTVFLALNLIAAGTGNIYFYGVTAIFYAIVTAPSSAFALEYGMELAFPVAEATLGGVWSLINQISSTVESLVIDSILGKTPTRGQARTSFIILAGYQFAAILLLFFVKEQLRRKEFESKDQDLKESNLEVNV